MQKEMSAVMGEGKAYWRHKAGLPSPLIPGLPWLALLVPSCGGPLASAARPAPQAVCDKKSHWDTDLTFRGCADRLQNVM